MALPSAGNAVKWYAEGDKFHIPPVRLALGCDAEALNGVVECGGKGIAVMPCGLDQIYPKTNQRLAEEILEKGGCLISEYPEGIGPRKENFVARDRLQALFSSLVIVVESREGSGTWHTVEYARGYKGLVACYLEKNGNFSKGNEMLVQSNKAYALKDNVYSVWFLFDSRYIPITDYGIIYKRRYRNQGF